MAKLFIEESTLTAIGDAIREKEGSTDLVPVTDMASRISAMTIGADNKLTYFVSSFANGCKGVVFPPDTELTVYLRGSSSISNAFLEARNLKYIKIFSENSLGNPDTEGSITMSSAFRDCEELEIVDLTECRRKLSSVDFIIFSSDKLKQILGALDISSIASISANTFRANALEEIRFDGEIISSLDFRWSKKLTRASMDSIRDHLSDSVTGKTCTFSSIAAYWGGFDLYMPDGLIPGVNSGPFDNGAWDDWTAVKPNWTITHV